jgi:S1-C subfamily serine protease
MRKLLAASAIAALTIVVAMPALAGGYNCSSHSQSASMAWGGAWLQRSPVGGVVVAEVAKGSPAARAGIKAGDIVTAVNGKDIAACAAHAGSCPAGSCTVGSSFTYTVMRGASTRNVKLKLERMPETASQQVAYKDYSFDPTLAAMVLPASR